MSEYIQYPQGPVFLPQAFKQNQECARDESLCPLYMPTEHSLGSMVSAHEAQLDLAETDPTAATEPKPDPDPKELYFKPSLWQRQPEIFTQSGSWADGIRA